MSTWWIVDTKYMLTNYLCYHLPINIRISAVRILGRLGGVRLHSDFHLHRRLVPLGSKLFHGQQYIAAIRGYTCHSLDLHKHWGCTPLWRHRSTTSFLSKPRLCLSKTPWEQKQKQLDTNVKEKGGNEGTLQGQKRWDFRICCMHTREGGGEDFQVNIK